MEKTTKTTNKATDKKETTVKEVVTPVVLTDIEVNGVNCKLTTFVSNGISEQLPNARIFLNSVQGGNVPFHFDCISKEGNNGTDHAVTFKIPLEREIVKICKGTVNEDWEYIALLGNNVKKGIVVGTKCISYSIRNIKTGQYACTHVISSSAIYVLTKILKLDNWSAGNSWYKDSVGRKDGSTKVSATLTKDESFAW